MNKQNKELLATHPVDLSQVDVYRLAAIAQVVLRESHSFNTSTQSIIHIRLPKNRSLTVILRLGKIIGVSEQP